MLVCTVPIMFVPVGYVVAVVLVSTFVIEPTYVPVAGEVELFVDAEVVVTLPEYVLVAG